MTGKYGLKQIAKELTATALGDAYYGNALRVAKDLPGLTDPDRALLDRYATGTQSGTDHVCLQVLASQIEDGFVADALSALITDFEYPDWSHKTVGDVLKFRKEQQ